MIVPAWNEGQNLRQLVPALIRLEELHEVIVVEAAPDPATAQIVRASGGFYLPFAAPNRGAQMNLGAEHATGDVFIFHHADSVLSAEHLGSLRHALADQAIIGGAFHRRFDDRHSWLRPLEPVARVMSRYGGNCFGDQSIFVRREVFCALGGFASIPLMEDMEFSRRLRRAGKIVVLDPPIISSGRRHCARGAWRTSLENGLFIALYKCGCSPARLHRWYYRERFSSPNESMVIAPVEETPPR